jgi:hypothetical protein
MRREPDAKDLTAVAPRHAAECRSSGGPGPAPGAGSRDSGALALARGRMWIGRANLLGIRTGSVTPTRESAGSSESCPWLRAAVDPAHAILTGANKIRDAAARSQAAEAGHGARWLLLRGLEQLLTAVEAQRDLVRLLERA